MISTKVHIKDDASRFIRKHDMAVDLAGARASADMETILKTSGLTPFKKGHLRNRTRGVRVGIKIFRVIMDVEYAKVQEQGFRAGAAPFTNYTTPGTGKGFMASAGQQIERKKKQYLREANAIVGLR